MAGPLERTFLGQSDPNVIALLSLKLLLLAFFILLNSLSVIEEDKQRVVIDSVSQAFDGRIQAYKNLSEQSAAAGQLAGAKDLAEELADLLDSTLPAIRLNEGASHSEVRVELPASMLFARGATELQPGRDLMLQRLSAALLRGDGIVFMTEVRHGVPEGALERLDDLKERSVELRRIGHLAQNLVEQGLPRERISTGLELGRPGAIILNFRAVETKPGGEP
ncbi:flagellar motor protein MotB [Pelagibius sp. Alg239-R121]|uniref:flagellar motor protein MotB n=1 Tax=Pelagibius sp. Alg239-R121 TaxID=2993448 RepID=UPI0024A738CE|nr:flagellar motor protein MotB [Pelagibius sp. Alg239-R121]